MWPSAAGLAAPESQRRLDMNSKDLRRIPFERGRLALLALGVLFALQACSPSTPTPPIQIGTITVATTDPQPPPLSSGGGECNNPYFPSEEDTVWETVGTNSLSGDYTSTTTVIESSDDGFTVRTVSSTSDVDFVLDYGCTDAGLVMLNPFDQFGTASATGPEGSATVNTLAASGLTLPSDLHAGQTWQQYLEFEVIGSGVTIRGEYTADNVARGLEVVHVPFGSFEAMRVDTEVQSTIGGEPSGTCQQTTWAVKDIGAVKGEGSCGDIDDSFELVSFDSP
jgi:hypothetical protein